MKSNTFKSQLAERTWRGYVYKVCRQLFPRSSLPPSKKAKVKKREEHGDEDDTWLVNQLLVRRMSLALMLHVRLTKR